MMPGECFLEPTHPRFQIVGWKAGPNSFAPGTENRPVSAMVCRAGVASNLREAVCPPTAASPDVFPSWAESKQSQPDTHEQKAMKELGVTGPIDHQTRLRLAELAQELRKKEERDKENARDPKTRLQEAMNSMTKASAFFSWLLSDLPPAPGGMAPSAALRLLMSEPDSAGLLLKLRVNLSNAGGAGESKMLDIISRDTSLSAANKKTITENMAAYGQDYLSSIARTDNLSEKFSGHTVQSC